MNHDHEAGQGDKHEPIHEHKHDGACGHDHSSCGHNHDDDKKAPHFHIEGNGRHQFMAKLMTDKKPAPLFAHKQDAHDHSGCDHDHDHDHGHDHNHTHDAAKKPDYNHGALKFIFSKVSGGAGEWLQRHRRKILLGGAAAMAAIEYKLTSSTMLSSAGLLLASAAVAHDASEDIMEVTGELKDSQNLSSGVVGTAVGFTHTLGEGLFSLSSTIQGNSDMAVSSVMGSNASHILLMAGGAAVIGTVGAGESTKWKLHAAGMAGLTTAFGYQVATGEFNPVLGAGMVAGGLYYLYQRVTSGESCVIHGDACGGNHDHGHNHDHSHDQSDTKPLTLQQRMTDPKLLQLGGSAVALTASAHVLGHQVLAQSQNMGISQTAAGAGIAALALAAPEIILTWKAAHKGDSAMAWGAITGCTVATVGVVGGMLAMSGVDTVMEAGVAALAFAAPAGYLAWNAVSKEGRDISWGAIAGGTAATVGLVGGALAMNGVDVPANLDITTTEGQIHMAAFGLSAAAVVGVTYPKAKYLKLMTKDGNMPKWLGGAFLAAGMAYYGTMLQSNCHFHGPREHCGADTIEIDWGDQVALP